MKTVHITEPFKCENGEDMQKPEAKAGEVLVKIKRIGLCGSDLNTFRGKNPMVTYPRIPGHEVAGEIVGLGDGVDNTKYAVGDKVSVLPYTNCGKCASCIIGRTNACKDNQTFGVQQDGALCEYKAVPYQKIINGVSDLEFSEIAMVEPLAVGFHAAKRGEVAEGDFVLSFGCGLVGLGAIAGAARRGGRVIAVDIDDAKIGLARECGAEFAVNSAKEDLEKRVMEITDGQGARVCIEAIGLAQTYKAAVDLVSFSGRVVYVGYASTPVDFTTKLFVMKELQIRGSRNADFEDFVEVLVTVRDGKIPVSKLITREVPLTDTGKALQEWSDDPAKVSKIIVSFDL